MDYVKELEITPKLIQRPKIEKVVVNVSVGKSGDALQRAERIIGKLTEQKPCKRKAKKTIREWGIRQDEPIACLVTLRGNRAKAFLKRGFDAVGNTLSKSSFDANGNFSFGIREHIEIPAVKYDPALGIIGMDVCVTIGKPGYRVKKRHGLKVKVGKRQRVTRDEAIEYIREAFNIKFQ